MRCHLDADPESCVSTHSINIAQALMQHTSFKQEVLGLFSYL
jgi:hypothetical protein